jgi:hypothetical protein
LNNALAQMNSVFVSHPSTRRDEESATGNRALPIRLAAEMKTERNEAHGKSRRRTESRGEREKNYKFKFAIIVSVCRAMSA